MNKMLIKKNRIFTGFFVACLVFFIAFSFVILVNLPAYFKHIYLLRNGIKVTGTVVHVDTISGGEDPDTFYSRVIYEIDGEIYMYSISWRRSLGEEILLFVDPDKPVNASWENTWYYSHYFHPALIIISVVFFIGSIIFGILYFKYRKKETENVSRYLNKGFHIKDGLKENILELLRPIMIHTKRLYLLDKIPAKKLRCALVDYVPPFIENEIPILLYNSTSLGFILTSKRLSTNMARNYTCGKYELDIRIIDIVKIKKIIPGKDSSAINVFLNEHDKVEIEIFELDFSKDMSTKWRFILEKFCDILQKTIELLNQ